jgi:MFS family permease
VFACVMSALAMAIISFASENESVDVLLVVCACLIGGLSEPVFFVVSGSWVADIFEDKLQDTYSAKARVMWASVIVNYAATAGAVIGPVVAGNFHDYLGWGETTRILSVVFWISGVVFWLFT